MSHSTAGGPQPVGAGFDPAYPPFPERLPETRLEEGRYRVRFARDLEELDEVFRLRFEVFNVELGEGLEASWASRRDRDPFDAQCHHLVVEELETGRLIGTYRLQTADMARQGLGFYSADEYDLSTLPPNVYDQSIELGRACIALDHRNRQVLFLLWRGLAAYVAHQGLRYFFGCCSLTSQDPVEGLAMAAYLEAHGHVHPSIRVEPTADYRCVLPAGTAPPGPGEPPPQLFRIYLRHGAKVVSPPAIDRRFQTIDFLILFDVAAMDEARVRMFFDAPPASAVSLD